MAKDNDLNLEIANRWRELQTVIQDLSLEIDWAHRIVEERDATIAELRTKVEILKTEIATLKSDRDEARDLLSGYETIARLNAKIADGAQWPEEAVVRATFEDGQEVEIWDLSPEFLAKLNG